MDGKLIADIVYYIILYSALALLALPVIYFCLWKFLGFFRKRKVVFYVLCIALFAAVIAGFYYTSLDWILWYYAFPSYVQITGLLLYAGSFMLMRTVDHQLGFKLRFFWPVLRDGRFRLSTGGLFKYVRHPIYALIPVLILGALLYTGEFVLLYPLFFNLLTRRWYSRKEEAYLKQFAEGDYEAFAKRTPNRFFPGFKRVTVAVPR